MSVFPGRFLCGPFSAALGGAAVVFWIFGFTRRVLLLEAGVNGRRPEGAA